MIDIVAVKDKIVVSITPKDNVSDGGIIIPDSAGSVTPQNSGEVLSVGQEIKDVIVPGDVVLFHERGGMDIMLGKVVLKVLKYDEVYAVLKPEEPLADNIKADSDE